MCVIKTGGFIEGIEVTSEHIGMELKVLGTTNGYRLPEGFITIIEDVKSDGVVVLKDATDVHGTYIVNLKSDCWSFAWVPITKKQRHVLAKAIREAKAVLDLAIQEAEEVGMVVDISDGNIRITFNPPVEEY